MRHRTLPAFLAILSVIIGAAACSEPEAPPAFRRPPRPIGSVTPDHGGAPLDPVRLTVRGDTLWVCYRSLPLIDAWALDGLDRLERVASVSLGDPEAVVPTSLVVTDSSFVVSDHARGLIVEFDRGGGVLRSFGTLPDGETALSPLAVTEFQGVVYAADIAVRRVLAIALGAGTGTRDQGELILTIPHDAEAELGFPCAVSVTPDGRLLVGDAKYGTIEVFTCDGRAVYEFDPVPDRQRVAPQGFAQDGVMDPAKQDPSSQDPSGIRQQGRIHVADSAAGQVHVYDAVGVYLLSYPQDGSLSGPAGIAVHVPSRRIFVADPGSGRIVVYRYDQEGT